MPWRQKAAPPQRLNREWRSDPFSGRGVGDSALRRGVSGVGSEGVFTGFRDSHSRPEILPRHSPSFGPTVPDHASIECSAVPALLHRPDSAEGFLTVSV